jgi:uncharacterized protein (TIGR00369 family)
MMNDDEYLRSSFREGNPFHQLLGVELEARENGYARVRLPVTPKLAGGVGGSVHGGVVSALADIASLAEQRPAGTAELNISYLRPALGAYVLAEARVLKRGRMLAVLDIDIKDPDDRLVAKGRVSYALRSVDSGQQRPAGE